MKKKFIAGSVVILSLFAAGTASAEMMRGGSFTYRPGLRMGSTTENYRYASGTAQMMMRQQNANKEAVRQNGKAAEKKEVRRGNSVASMTGNGQPIVGGKVMAISGTVIALANNGGALYTIEASGAKIIREGKETAFGTIQIGDGLIVQGTINGTSVTAATIIDSGAPKTLLNTQPAEQPNKKPFEGFSNLFTRLFHFF